MKIEFLEESVNLDEYNDAIQAVTTRTRLSQAEIDDCYERALRMGDDAILDFMNGGAEPDLKPLMIKNYTDLAEEKMRRRVGARAG